LRPSTKNIEGYKRHPFPQAARTHTYEETASTHNLKRYLRYTSSSHHEHIFKKKEYHDGTTKEISEVCNRRIPYTVFKHSLNKPHMKKESIILLTKFESRDKGYYIYKRHAAADKIVA